jgi:hypothetical protein
MRSHDIPVGLDTCSLDDKSDVSQNVIPLHLKKAFAKAGHHMEVYLTAGMKNLKTI